MASARRSTAQSAPWPIPGSQPFASTPVDCAGLIGSDNRVDICGVCRGENRTCVHHQYTFWGRPRYRAPKENAGDPPYDYEMITTIPAGATLIYVEEKSRTNFLALADVKNNYAVNGNWRIQAPGRIVQHGLEMIYNRTWDGTETLSVPGPLKFDSHIYVLGSGDVPRVRYEYWVSSRVPLRREAVAPLHPLSQVKEREGERTSSATHFFSTADNYLYDNPASATPTAVRGYKSYYHRNEILESVPSWSVKRRRFHTKNLDGHTSPANKVSYSYTKTDNGSSALVPQATASGFQRSLENPRPTGVSPDRSPNSNKTPSKSTVVLGGKILTNTHSNRYQGLHSVPYSLNSEQAWSRPTRGDRKFPKTRGTTGKHTFSRVYPPNSKRNGSAADIGRPSYTMAQTRTVENPEPSESRRSKPSRKRGNRLQSPQGCHPCTKSKEQARNFCSSDFVLRAVVLSSEKRENSTRYELQISQSFKNKVPISPREYVWNASPCRCPKLRNGREYIVMGRSGTSADKRESRLLIDRHSFVKKYSRRKSRAVLRLIRNQHEVCKQFEK